MNGEEEESNPNNSTVNNNSSSSSSIVIAMGPFTYSESLNPKYAVVNMFPNIGDYLGGTHVTFDTIVSGEEETPQLPPPSPICCFGSTLVRARYDVSKRIITCVAPMAPIGQQNSSIPVSVVDSTSIAWNEVLCDVDTASTHAVGWFNYVPKVELHEISPKKGPTIGGTNITLIGSGFESHAGTLECEFLWVNGSAATLAIVESDTRASCISPSIINIIGPSINGNNISSYVQLTSEGGTNLGVGLQLFQYIEIFLRPFDHLPDSVDDGEYGITLELFPSLGPETGNTIVTITSNSEMYADISVICKFGDTLSLAPSRCISVNSMTCITPPHPPGTVDVRISIDGQQYANKHGVFTYHAIAVASAVLPSYGPSIGGTPVIITGSGYINSGDIVVSFGHKTAHGKFLNASAIEAITPSIVSDGIVATSSHDNDEEQLFTTVPVSVSLNGAVKLETDVISSPSTFSMMASFMYSHLHFGTFSWKLSPSAAPMEGGTMISIWLPLDWENGRYTMANFSVKLTDTYGGGIFGLGGNDDQHYKSSQVIVSSSSSSENQLLSFVVPSAEIPGMVDVELLYGGTQATSFVHQFLYYSSEDQGIVAMSPTFGPDNGGTIVTVLGSGFTSLGSFSAPVCIFSVGSEATATAAAVDFDSVAHAPARISSKDIITCTMPTLGEIPSVTGPGPISLQISLNGRDSVPGILEFTYVSALTVLSVWPSTGSINGGTRVVVRGTMFISNIATAIRGSAASTSSYSSSPPTLWCRFGDQLVMADEVIDSTTAVCTTPPIAVTQVVGVSVGYNLLDFSEELHQGFAYHDEISITGLFPAIGPLAGGTVIRISGKGFAASHNDKQSAATVTCRFGTDSVVEATTVESSSTNGQQNVLCIAPSWVERQPQKVIVGISLNGVDFVLSPQLFGYFPIPIITKAVPCIGPETGGTRVVLFGTGFVSSVPFMCDFLDDEAITTTSLLLSPPIIAPAQYLSSTSVICISPPGKLSSNTTIKLSLAGNQYACGPGGVTFSYHPTLLVTTIEPAFGGELKTVMVSTVNNIGKIFDDLANNEYGDRDGFSAGNITCGFTGLTEGFVSVPAIWFEGTRIACVTPSMDFTMAETEEIQVPTMIIHISISLNGIDFSESYANFTYTQSSIAGGVSPLALSPLATPKEGGGQLIFSFPDTLTLPPISEILICRLNILGIVMSQGGEQIPQYIASYDASNIQWEIESLAVRTNNTPSSSLVSCEVPAIPPLWKKILNSVQFVSGGKSYPSSTIKNGHYVNVEIISGSSYLPIAPPNR